MPPQSGDTRPQLIFSAHDNIIWVLVFLPDGRRVVFGSDDGTIGVWNLHNGRREGSLMKHKTTISSLALTRDGTKIISSDDDREIRVWDVESHETIKEWAFPDFVPSIAISPDDRLFAVGDRTVGIYTIAGEKVNHSIEVGNRSWSLSFSPDGNRLACGTPDDIRIYDVATGTLIIGPLQGHEDWIWRVLWSRDGNRLLSSSQDTTIRCWNSTTGEQTGLPWTGHTGGVYSISLSPDESILASASWDKTVRFWNATSGDPIAPCLHHEQDVTTVSFSPSGEFVASAGWDGKIYVWRVPKLNSIESQVISLLSLLLLILIMLHYRRVDTYGRPISISLTA